ncbi:SpoU rRNA methylase family protein [Winogradskyella epiphytica]|uniref:SpoU rRNA methylase family protein n=1 Tax=Winogradskyella epiphytica TaxID=262005 RepID=A0A2V4XFD5_9FLAO|nr:TrmH family RNA methyltransferase [Winogradskyella epiphytica]PYE81775.1 SpoU rRNA methylase family protein [Winogradskyella epiphytica]GGW62766.1 RNA methyltransferase [Winogradskyella epiphytica]
MQLNHYNTNFKKQKHPITLVCDNVTNAPNIGSLFRIADAFGIDQLIFCGSDIPLGKRMTKTSRSTEKYVSHSVKDDIETVVKDLKDQGHYLIALEITENSQPLTEFKLTTTQPIVIILGDEKFGISETILKQVDAIIHINMFGNNSSMNVVQATGITLYEITKQLNS